MPGAKLPQPVMKSIKYKCRHKIQSHTASLGRPDTSVEWQVVGLTGGPQPGIQQEAGRFESMCQGCAGQRAPGVAEHGAHPYQVPRSASSLVPCLFVCFNGSLILLYLFFSRNR